MNGDGEITQAEFARRLKMTRQRVSRFVKDGVIQPAPDGKIPFLEGVVALVEHLSEVAAGRGGGSAQADLSKERALLAKAQRENLELRNRALKDDYCLTSDVSQMVNRIVISFRNRMLSIPSWLGSELQHLTRADVAVADRLIRDVLTQLADEEDAIEAELLSEKKKKCRG